MIGAVTIGLCKSQANATAAKRRRPTLGNLRQLNLQSPSGAGTWENLIELF